MPFFIGPAVRLAARLDRAEPGTVLVSSAVHDLVLGKGFAFRKRGRLRLKGLLEPVQVVELVWQDEAAGSNGTPIPTPA